MEYGWRTVKDSATNRKEREKATSLSGSPKLPKSWKSGAASFSILYTDFLSIPKKEEAVIHPERACAAGSVSDQEVFDCPDLYSTQEEADTRMILQALHADKRLKKMGKQGMIIIKTSNFFQSGIFCLL
jgi:hypothetical protein